jgi:predicted small lipoprotein YifL
VPELSSSSDPRLVRIAVIGAFVAALGLAGCGRKGGLDPPPTASVDQGGGVQPAPGPESGVGPDGKAMAPARGPQRRTPIDFLID